MRKKRSDALAPEVKKAHLLVASRRFYARNREQILANAKIRDSKKPGLMRMYGITETERIALFKAQGEVCACCGGSSPKYVRGWHTDHDHATREIRGILCQTCNHRLGRMGDNLENVLKRAKELIEYLLRGPAVKIGPGS